MAFQFTVSLEQNSRPDDFNLPMGKFRVHDFDLPHSTLNNDSCPMYRCSEAQVSRPDDSNLPITSRNSRSNDFNLPPRDSRPNDFNLPLRFRSQFASGF